MKTHMSFIAGALLALASLPASAQILQLNPGPGSGIVSSHGASFDNGLTIKLEFDFSYAPSTLSLKVSNLGDLTQAASSYKITQFGFNSPSSWGTVSLLTPYPSNPGNSVTSLSSMGNFFDLNSFSTWVGTGNSNQTNQLDIDKGESATLLFSFSAAPALSFNLASFFNANTAPDMGFRIQPMSLVNSEIGSDKWIYNYTTPPPTDVPPPTPVPEPGTYGLIGMAGLAGLVAWRRMRRRT